MLLSGWVSLSTHPVGFTQVNTCRIIDMPGPAADAPIVKLPYGVRTSAFFIDESGAKGSGGDFFVVATVKTDDPDALSRGMEDIRHRHQFRRSEFKFGDVTSKSMPTYRELVELLYQSGAQLGAFVIDKKVHDPFVGRQQWEGHAWVAAALVKGMTTRRELVSILIDGISVPRGVSYGREIQDKINRHFRCTRVVSALSLDSCTCDGLQVADLVASSIAHQRRALRTQAFEQYASGRSEKTQLSLYLARTFGLTMFADQRTDRVNIKTVTPALDTSAPRQAEVVQSVAATRLSLAPTVTTEIPVAFQGQTGA